MKRSILLFLLTFIMSAPVFAQQSTLVVFSEDGYPFRVMLNGMFQNQNPETNVKINQLNPASYKLKIFFKDTANGTLTETVYINAGMEQVYVLKKKAISDTERSLKKFGEEWKGNWNVQSKEEAAAKSKEIDKKRERFVMRKLSEAQIAAPASTQATQSAPASRTAPTATATQSTTTTTSSTGIAETRSSGVSMSVSVNANVPAAYSTTTTTTTTSSSTATGQTVYLPGYTGPVGCPVPMNEQDFSNVRATINSKTFEDSKLTVARQVVNSNCLFSSQVRDIMTMFTFEDTRLELAKSAYGHTYDIGNYYMVNDAFQFESSIDELQQHINNTRKR